MKCILNILSLNTKTSNVNLTYNSYGKNQSVNSVLLQVENNVLTLDSSKCYKILQALRAL